MKGKLIECIVTYYIGGEGKKCFSATFELC